MNTKFLKKTFGLRVIIFLSAFICTTVSAQIQNQGALFRVSLVVFSSDFSVYDVVSNTWATLTPFYTGAQLAASDDGRLFGWNRTVGAIQQYDSVSDSWSTVQITPPGASGRYGNLEFIANGEWVYTESQSSTLHYTVNGVWQTLTLPFTASAIGDYDSTTNTLMIGEYFFSRFYSINMDTLQITGFLQDFLITGERRRCGEIHNGRFYYQGGSKPVKSIDLANNGLPPVDLTPGIFFESCATSGSEDVIFLNDLNGVNLWKVDLNTQAVTNLSSHTSIGNNSSITWAGITMFVPTPPALPARAIPVLNLAGLITMILFMATTAWFARRRNNSG
ncbi:MAG: hypothetical protein L3J22_08845 [Xanthomonadales bacterium]|nr:hypothetical protein [Xanthomonadales bacterium]